MKRQWRVQRQVVAAPDGQRRWDRAYQLLLAWAPPPAAEMAATPSASPPKEVTHASSDLPAGLDPAAGAGADD